MRFFLIFIFISLAFLQNLKSNFESTYDLEKNRSSYKENSFQKQSSFNSFSFNTTLLDAVVDPDKYLVGPGDSFTFNILSADGVINMNLYVNPTGEILIPSVGKVYVNNKTLKQSINSIENKCFEKYPNVNVHISLNKIRQFKIQVKGIYDIVNYVNATPVLRVSDVIEPIIEDYNFKNQTNELDSSHIKNENKKLISKRNIKILRNNDTIHVDLLAFNRFGDYSKILM